MASSTVLGWVLSGLITLGNSSFTSSCFETHSMHCNIENTAQEAENLESVYKDMWQKLPFKPGHEFLSDNFSVCEQRLKKLKNLLTSELSWKIWWNF